MCEHARQKATGSKQVEVLKNHVRNALRYLENKCVYQMQRCSASNTPMAATLCSCTRASMDARSRQVRSRRPRYYIHSSRL